MGILKQLSQYTDLITPKEFLQDYSKIVFLLIVSSKFFVSNLRRGFQSLTNECEVSRGLSLDALYQVAEDPF